MYAPKSVTTLWPSPKLRWKENFPCNNNCIRGLTISNCEFRSQQTCGSATTSWNSFWL